MQEQNNSILSSTRSETDSNEDLDFLISDLAHVLWARRYFLIKIFILVFTVGLMQVSQLTPEYSAETILLLGVPKNRIVNIQEVFVNNLNRRGALTDEIEVIKSRDLIKKIIKKYNLLEFPEFNPTLKESGDPGILHFLNPKNWISKELKDEIKASIGMGDSATRFENLREEEQAEQLLINATDIYLNQFRVKNNRHSYTIRISYTSTNPKLAAKIVNYHAEIYLINQLEIKFDATEKASTWLNERLYDLRSKVKSSEQAVEFYRSKYNLAGDEGVVSLLNTQLTTINSMLIIASSERAAAEVRLQQIQKIISSDADIETADVVISSKMVQSLRQQESSLRRRMSEMSVDFGVKHPKMIRINAEIKNVKANIATEISKVTGALKNEVETKRIKEESLKSSLSNLKLKTGQNRQETVQLRALKREATANKALFKQFLSRFKETTFTQSLQEPNARIISKAEIPKDPSGMNTTKMIMILAAVALFLAITTVFLLEALHLGLRTPEEIEKIFNRPTLAITPLVEAKIDPIDYMLDNPHSNFTEALNALRVSLALSNPDKQAKTLLIASAVPGEGKSTLAICLARGAALSGQKVALIETDLRRPSIVRKLNIQAPEKGLIDFIIEQSHDVYDYMTKDEKSGMYVMSKGGNAEYTSPTDIFTSNRMTSIIAALKQEFELVIFDTPPVLTIADARALVSQVDKAVFVVKWDSTSRKLVKAAIQQISNAKPNLAGIVLQQVDLKQYNNYYYGNYNYYYHYDK